MKVKKFQQYSQSPLQDQPWRSFVLHRCDIWKVSLTAWKRGEGKVTVWARSCLTRSRCVIITCALEGFSRKTIHNVRSSITNSILAAGVAAELQRDSNRAQFLSHLSWGTFPRNRKSISIPSFKIVTQINLRMGQPRLIRLVDPAHPDQTPVAGASRVSKLYCNGPVLFSGPKPLIYLLLLQLSNNLNKKPST